MRDALLSTAVAILAGAYSIVLWRELPPIGGLPLAVAAALMLVANRRRACRLAGSACLGFVLIWGAAADIITDRLDPTLEGRDIDGVFRIVEFVDDRPRNTRFLASPADATGLPGRIRLSWFDTADAPALGECWRLTVRLRRPRGLANPGGFDYERWLFENGIGATGYVREGVRAFGCAPPPAGDAVRARLATRLSARLGDEDVDEAAAGVLLAITLGARHRISREQWQQYAATGTSHLMAISGMHVGLAAAAAFLLCRLLLSVPGSRASHRDLAILGALLTAGVYAALSGFAVPARRALTMLAIAALGTLLGRPVAAARLVSMTCIVIVLTDPISIMTPGFKLSFAAVVVLIWLSRPYAGPDDREPRGAKRAVGRLRALGGLQLGLALGLFALTLASFGRVAWLAPAVNLVVVPLFNVVTVPTALLGFALDGPLQPLGDGLLTAALASVRAILAIVAFSSELPGAALTLARPNGLAAVTSWLVAAWVLLPAGWPGRRVALVAVAATLCTSPTRPPEGCVDLHVLDVGQGLAAAVQTQERVLVFDTGPAFRSGTDTGELVVVPFLTALGIDAVDVLIVSHADQDHAGGAASVLAAVDTRVLLSGEPLADAAVSQLGCTRGQLWEWGGVRFRILHPRRDDRRLGNDRSCVLEIAVGDYRALLTGDIEAPVERELVRAGLLADADLVIIPHHGSATSSHARFVDALTPSYAIASAAAGNRWGMPKPMVVARWRDAGATVLETASSGALSFRMCADSGIADRREFRVRARRFWHEP